MNPTRAPDDADLERQLRDSRRLEDAPESVIQRAIGVWTARPATAPGAAARAGGALRRLAAALSFDSLGQTPQAAGLRAGDSDGLRQLLFSADGRDVDLRLQRSADGRHWSVSGQVLGPDLQGRALLHGAGPVREAAWDELAEFRFDAVPAGAVTLELQGQDWVLELPPLDLAP